MNFYLLTNVYQKDLNVKHDGYLGMENVHPLVLHLMNNLMNYGATSVSKMMRRSQRSREKNS